MTDIVLTTSSKGLLALNSHRNVPNMRVTQRLCIVTLWNQLQYKTVAESMLCSFDVLAQGAMLPCLNVATLPEIQEARKGRNGEERGRRRGGRI